MGFVMLSTLRLLAQSSHFVINKSGRFLERFLQLWLCSVLIEVVSFIIVYLMAPLHILHAKT
jgi:hypothetical protein